MFACPTFYAVFALSLTLFLIWCGVDVFCGYGYGYGTHLLSTSRHVLGIDGSTDAIRLAEQHYRTPNALFSQARSPFSLPSQAFDFAVSLESVEHVEQGEAFIAILAASLKPGGTVNVIVPDIGFHARQLLGLTHSALPDQEQHAFAGFRG